MINFIDENLKFTDRKSSKGNQLKMFQDGIWYKADYCGYEGLAEYVISCLLEKTSLRREEFVTYAIEKIRYKNAEFRGCKSADFLEPGEQLITLERLFNNFYGQSLTKSVYLIQDREERIRFIVEQVERATGIENFGAYMVKLLTLDAFFLNEDRHMHNIAIIQKNDDTYRLGPIFDNGAGLLSDTMMEYPMSMDTDAAMKSVKAKTFDDSFDTQLEIAERLYGQRVQFLFTKRDVKDILDNEKYYPEDVKNRVYEIIVSNMRKYTYLF